MSAEAEIALKILMIPLASAGVIALFFRRSGGIASLISLLASFGILYFSWQLMNAGVIGRIWSVSWIELGSFVARAGILFDSNTATMLFVVAFIGFWIHVFSLGYMNDDGSKARYFGGLSIFMFSMLGIVLADNLIMIFVFWELVGFSSYMLISHYFTTKEASEASKKAFIVNRVGDFGFLLGIIATYWYYGTVDLMELSDSSLMKKEYIAALLMCGFLGKSAQFPLQVWLPDAMAGPTPVSALIHAATMVAAGIFFLVRIQFMFTADLLTIIAWLGTSMALYAGCCAMVQRDIKKVLAYSTLSQLGYMTAAFGLGMPGLALFHLVTHAFFKGLLFLGSGSVIHGCHHEQDIFKMGGLYKKMPITTLTFGIGVLAISGVTGLSGYFSKDAILIAAGAHDQKIFVVLMISALITAFYMGRLYWITFFGKANSEKARKAKESPITMTFSLIVLAVGAILVGYHNLWPEVFKLSVLGDLNLIHGVTESSDSEAYGATHHLLQIMGTVAWVLGLFGSMLFYGMGAKEDRFEKTSSFTYGFLQKRLFFDEIYNWYVAKVQQKIADILNLIDLLLVSGLMVRGTAGFVGLLGIVSRAIHTGNLHVYLYWIAIGALALLWLVIGNWS